MVVFPNQNVYLHFLFRVYRGFFFSQNFTILETNQLNKNPIFRLKMQSVD